MCTSTLLFPPKLFIGSQYLWSACYSQTFGHLCQSQMLVSLVPTVQIFGLWRIWNMYCSLMSPPSLSFPHLWELWCGEAPKRLLRSQSEATGWNGDGLGCNIMAFLNVLDGYVTAKDYWTILEDHIHLMVQILYPEGGAVYQHDNAPIHTAKLVTECSLMNMKVKLHISHGLHSHQI